jgi:hypothetical protein
MRKQSCVIWFFFQKSYTVGVGFISYFIYSNSMASQIVCAICGSEVKQVGDVFRCQNYECKAETPIDVQEAVSSVKRDATVEGINEISEAE